MPLEEKELLLFLNTLKENSAYDFFGYSKNSLERRILKIRNDFRMNHSELIDRLSRDQDFREIVVKKITVNTTDFFRDIDFWLYMKNKILPLFAMKDEINIWHPGCSTGQEVYSMMIVLEEMNLLGKARIFATDINADVLDIAREGVFKTMFNKNYLINYTKVINHNNNHEIVDHRKYFGIDEKLELIKMNSSLCKKPIFRKMDLVTENNPFNQPFDIIVCRNVIIYFNQELQDKVLNLFHINLNHKGILALGIHESIIGKCLGCFQKKEMVYIKKN